MSGRRFQGDDPIMLSLTPGVSYDFQSPETLFQLTPEPGEPQASKKWNRPKVAELITWWDTILVTSCVLAVLFDPLFFYIPFIDNENKCLGIDKKVRLAALISRSLTDITFVVHIIWQLYEASEFAALKVITRELKLQNTERQLIDPDAYEWSSRDEIIEFAKAFSHKLSWHSFITDLLAVFPMPQLLIVGLFFEMRGTDYLERRKVLSGFLLVQYLPRIYRIYISSKKLRKSTAIWLKGAFNFFMYIIFSHIIGAFWYFFSIERVTSCWHQTYCKTPQGCTTTYYCDNTALINIPLINGSCPISPPNTGKFDFGMFSDGLQSGITGPISFSVKLLYSLWWGLRNLSNFGTSLATSTYVWENSFAILISVVGLLLFCYLIGNMQQCMQWEEEKKAGSDKLESIKEDIEKWMDINELNDEMKGVIMKTIKKKLEDDVEFDAANLENLFTILPWNTKKSLKRVICMSMLTNVPMLTELNGRVLKMICDYLKPVHYPENTLVFRMGEPLDRMVFIAEGFMWTYASASESTAESMDTNFLRRGDFYGSELLQFASSSLTLLPASATNVKCHTNVEAFVLMAKDLRTVVIQCEMWWPFDYDVSKDEAGGSPPEEL